MRYLGIDYGTKRVGVALSDESGTMAFPREVIENDASLQEKIESIITNEKVGEVVIGHSLNTKGEPNELHKAVEALMTDLTLSLGIPVHLQPEQYTTQEAIKLQGRNDMTDAAAATIILNTFLATKQ